MPNFPWQKPDSDSDDDAHTRDASNFPWVHRPNAPAAPGRSMPWQSEATAGQTPTGQTPTEQTPPDQTPSGEPEAGPAPAPTHPSPKPRTKRAPMAPAHPIGAPQPSTSRQKKTRTRPQKGLANRKRPRNVLRSATGARMTVVIVVAALVIVGVGYGVITSMNSTAPNDEPLAAPVDVSEEAPPEERAIDVGNDLLEAIRTADAGAVQNLLGTTLTGDVALVTDAVLAEMLERYPFSSASVTPIGPVDSGDIQRVDVSYRLGDHPFVYEVDIDTRERESTDGAIDLDLPLLTFDGGYGDMEVTVNGSVAGTGSGAIYSVVPGVYELETTAAYVELSGGPVVATTGFAYAYTHEHEPVLTNDGLAEFRSRVRASAEACLSATSLDADCELSVTPGLQGDNSLVDGTIERSISDESWAEIDALEPTASSSAPLVMEDAFFSAEVIFTGDWSGAFGAGRDQIYGGPYLSSPTVDFADPDLPVTWGY